MMPSDHPISEAHADHGTVLKRTESAIVAGEDGELSFLLGDYGDADVPEGVQLLAAVLIKSRDPEWVAEMLAELDGGA